MLPPRETLPPIALPFLDFTYPDVPSNLALDEALLIAAEERAGGAVLRVWESPTTAVVLGASGRLREDVDVDACRSSGVTIARRSSGGGTVVIGPGALNVTVVLANDAAPGLNAVDMAQSFVLERIARSIRRSGWNALVQGSGDLTLNARKFSGSAQRRLKRHFLVHASLLYDFPIETIVRLTRLPRRQPDYRAGRSHEDFLTNVNMSRDQLLNAVRDAWGVSTEQETPVNLPADLVSRLVTEKFADPAWIERL